MDGKTSEWRPGPTVCRCCLTEGCYKDISTEYFWMGKREVYAEMLSETLNVSIAYSQSGGPNSNSRLICEPCISRLRDASEFKRQVQECEKTFMQHLDPGTTTTVTLEVEAVSEETDKSVKLERVKQEKQYSDDDFAANDFPAGDDDDDDDLDDQPLTKFASKVPKKESVDLLDLLDNSQITLKRKSKAKTPTAKKAKVAKKEPAKATASKAVAKPVTKKKKDSSPLSIARRNALIIVRHTTAYPFRLPEATIMCVFCCDDFQQAAQFRRHMELEHESFKVEIAFAHCPDGYVKADCTDLRCKLCNEKFPELRSIAKHLLETHGAALTIDSDLGIHPFKFPDEKLLCGNCNINFPSLRQLSKHVASHYKNFTCEGCGKSYTTNNSLQQHLRFSHIKDELICRKCKQTFSSPEARREHVNSTPKCWTYQCQLCTQRFITWKCKQDHLVEVHGQKRKTYSCPECDEEFHSRSGYREHFSTTHSVVSFSCSYCAKSFSTKHHLDQHTVTHTGLKLYKCDVCSKSFPGKKNLKQHMWIHSEVKRFECVGCNKKFNQKVSYVTHMKNYHPGGDKSK